jgi:hypothetical protein
MQLASMAVDCIADVPSRHEGQSSREKREERPHLLLRIKQYMVVLSLIWPLE